MRKYCSQWTQETIFAVPRPRYYFAGMFLMIDLFQYSTGKLDETMSQLQNMSTSLDVIPGRISTSEQLTIVSETTSRCHMCYIVLVDRDPLTKNVAKVQFFELRGVFLDTIHHMPVIRDVRVEISDIFKNLCYIYRCVWYTKP